MDLEDLMHVPAQQEGCRPFVALQGAKEVAASLVHRSEL
jgi:hypothetical protein